MKNSEAAFTIRSKVPVKLAGNKEALFTTFNNIDDEHIAIVFGNALEQNAPLVRVHSECLTGDVFHSRFCDCGQQLTESINTCSVNGGIILYLRQEGRGIGLYNKLDSYLLQHNNGLNTYDANHKLGFKPDLRDYKVASSMLLALGVGSVKLLTNNPEKVEQLRTFGVSVIEQIPTGVYIHDDNRNYITSKRARGHVIAEPEISSLSEILSELRLQKPVIIVDDEDRENEGDLFIPAETLTQEVMTFMIRKCGGIVCATIEKQLADTLDLPLQPRRNLIDNQAHFTVSIEAAHGMETGVSSQDRTRTIKQLLKPNISKSDISTPGHVFPLIANERGVLGRAGHTEAAVELSKLAGYKGVGVICEIINEDGTMARLNDLHLFAQQYNLKIGTIKDIIEFRNIVDDQQKEAA
jgi:3,4-dihydroxy-2-butanone 4-phosphate synthase/GTP cyclohydrolase II